MYDQIIEIIKTLAPVGSFVVSILAYKESKNKNKSKKKGKNKKKK
ncbi:hypothetical protein [Peribacillus frigoritolerans]